MIPATFLDYSLFTSLQLVEPLPRGSKRSSIHERALAMAENGVASLRLERDVGLMQDAFDGKER
jgi:hypothetical protein